MTSNSSTLQLKRLLLLFSTANLIQWGAALVITLQEKSAEAVFLGMSRERLIIFLGLCLGLGIFGLLLAASVRKPAALLEKIDRGLYKYYVWCLAWVAVYLIFLWFGFIVLQSLYPIYLVKIWFIPVFGALMGLESWLLLIGLPESYKKSQDQWTQKYQKYQPLIGYSLIAIAGVIGFLLRYYGVFVDEGDHFAVGRLMAQGRILYSDIFSHHPPLPYHWIAGVIRIFGADLGIIRFSLVILWVTVFGVTAHLTKRYLAFGILAVTWAGTSCLYLANLLNYHPFAGIFLVASTAMILYLDEKKDRTRLYFVWLGAMLVLAVLSNMMMAWPVAMLGICFLVILFGNKDISKRQAAIYLAFTVASGLGVLLLFVIPMLFNHSLAAAFDGIITFNTEIYSKYTSRTANQLPIIWNQMRHGLDSIAFIKNGEFKFWNVLDQISEGAWNIDYWIMGGIAFRLSVILMAVLLLLAKKPIRALTVYAIAATTNGIGFHNAPFAIFSLFIMATLVSQDGLLRPCNSPKLSTISTAIYNLTVRLIWIIVIITLCSNVYAYLIERRETINFDYRFSGLAVRAENLRRWECGNSSTKYLVYPLEPWAYFFLERQPASKYMFMTPWVAEVGQQELIADIQAEPYVVVYLQSDASIWEYPAKEYLSDFWAVLEKNYVQVESDIWVSPALYSQCSGN